MAASKEQRNRPPNAGNGRPKGAKNKLNREIRDMILTALETAGGVDYLVQQTKENPRVFLGIRILVWEDRTSPSCLTALVR